MMKGEEALVLSKNYMDKERRQKPFNLLEHPAVDIVFDSCYRKVSTRTNAENMVLDSGHTLSGINFRGEIPPTITHESNGTLEFNGHSSNLHPQSGWLVEGFSHETPYIEFRTSQNLTPSWIRMYYLKYIDENNWIGVQRSTAGTIICISVNGVVTNVASSDTGYSGRLYNSAVITFRAEIRDVHGALATSGRAVVVYESEQEVMRYGITQEDWEFLKAPGKIGFGSRFRTSLFGFKAGAMLF